MTPRRYAFRALALSAAFALSLVVSPRGASAAGEGGLMPPPHPSASHKEEAPPSPAPGSVAELSGDDGEGIYDGGRASLAGEAKKPEEERDYSGPLGGMGISCEDQKDLEALAFGTYGNLLKALAGNPTIVKCPGPKEGPEPGGSPSSAGGPAGTKAEGK